MANILQRRGGRDRRRGKEGERSNERDKKTQDRVAGHATIETYIKKGLEAEKGSGEISTKSSCGGRLHVMLFHVPAAAPPQARVAREDVVRNMTTGCVTHRDGRPVV